MSVHHRIVVPAIHPGNTAGMLESMEPGYRRRVILIDNSGTGQIAARWDDEVAASFANDDNLGVAASWNLGAQAAVASGATFVTLCSTSCRFTDGARGLCRTADLAWENEQWPWGFESLRGWHLITLGARTFAEVGWFDETFWPAYFEDNDYIWRCRLAGVLERDPRGDRSGRRVPWVGAIDVDLVQTAHAIEHCGIEVNFAALGDYYVAKWGGSPGFEQFERPFDGAEPPPR